jgi:hypothetical protein
MEPRLKMSKDELIKAAIMARTHLRKTIEELSPEQIVQPAMIGNWSVMEVFSHIAGWDVWMYSAIQSIHELEQLDLSAVKNFGRTNAKFVAERANWTIEQVLAEMAKVFQEMLHFVETIPEGQLSQRRMFDGQNWSLDRFLRIWDEHDHHHADKIQLWWKTQQQK